MVCNMKFIKYRENKLIVTTYVQNVRLWLKHKLASVLTIGQLYHQSATAPRCTTQMRMCVVCHFLSEDQVNQFRAPFLTNFLHLFVSSSYQKIPKSVAEHRGLSIPVSFKSKLCLLQYPFKIVTSYLLKFTWQWRHVYVMNKKVKQVINRQYLFLFPYM